MKLSEREQQQLDAVIAGLEISTEAYRTLLEQHVAALKVLAIHSPADAGAMEVVSQSEIAVKVGIPCF